MSSNSSDKNGNGVILEPIPKKQISPAKNWCFTFNNYSENDISSIISKNEISEYIIGKEIGENGTPHLQGYLTFKKKLRPKGLFNEKIHWEKAKGNRQQNLDYCMKDGDFVSNMDFPEKVETIQPVGMYDWQLVLLELISKKPHPRNIYWYVGPQGCGKTAFMKYACVSLGAIILSGGAKDMKNGIAMYKKNKKGKLPKIIFSNLGFDTDLSRISYKGYEDIKDLTFYSPKYEGDMVLGNPCHLIIFANFPPISDNEKFIVVNVK